MKNMKDRKINMKQLFALIGILCMPFYGMSQTTFAKVSENYSGVDRIEIQGRFSDVKILGSENQDVKFEGVIRGKVKGSKDYKIKHRQEGSVLKVWVESPRVTVGWSRLESYLKFKVPYNMDIDITNTSGDIYIEEIVSEEMRLKATSGDFELKNIETNLTSTTTSGDLDINYLKGAISATSTSGDQSFNHIRANVSSRASSGDIVFFDVIGNMNTRTTSGDLQFEEVEGRISNVSTSGNMNISKAKTILDLLATSGDIRGERIELIGDSKFKTTSGNVTINFENDIEGMSFDLRASSGDLRAGNRSSDKKLYSKHGEVWVYGRSTSGDQNYR